MGRRAAFEHRASDVEANLISIIIPVKNQHPRLLAECVASAMKQSSRRFEIIIACHSEEDKQAATSIAGSYALYCGGETFAMAINNAMVMAKGDFVTELLSDDIFFPNAITTLEGYRSAFPDVDFFHSSRIFIDSESRPISDVYWAKNDYSRNGFLHGTAKHLLCWRKSKALEMGGIAEGRHGADDYDFPFCMFEAGAKFAPVMECLYGYRDHIIHPRGTMHVPMDEAESCLREWLKKHRFSEEEIEREVTIRKDGYMSQALYLSAGVRNQNPTRESYYGRPIT